jgi:hypothetical protein
LGPEKGTGYVQNQRRKLKRKTAAKRRTKKKRRKNMTKIYKYLLHIWRSTHCTHQKTPLHNYINISPVLNVSGKYYTKSITVIFLAEAICLAFPQLHIKI